MSTARRMSRMMQPRLSRERLSTFGSHDHSHNVRLENTYRLEPNRKVRIGDVRRTVKSALEDYLEDKRYCANNATQWTKELSHIIKTEVKLLGYPRHKIVAMVTLLSKNEPAPTMCFTSQAVWQPDFDNYTEAVYENKDICAVAVVYVIYLE